jgi:hypothetical protein
MESYVLGFFYKTKKAGGLIFPFSQKKTGTVRLVKSWTGIKDLNNPGNHLASIIPNPDQNPQPVLMMLTIIHSKPSDTGPQSDSRIACFRDPG